MGTRQVPARQVPVGCAYFAAPGLVSPNSTGSLLPLASKNKSEPCLARSEPPSPSFVLKRPVGSRGRDIATP